MDLAALLERLIAGDPLTAEELAALDDDTLGEFEGLIVAAFDERVPENGPAPSDAQLEEAAALQAAVNQVREQASERIVAAEDRSTRARELLSQVHVADEPPEPEPLPEVDPEAEVPLQPVDTPVADITPDPAPVEPPVVEAVAAAARTPRTPLRNLPRSTAPPVPARSNVRIIAAPDLPNMAANSEMTLDDLTASLFESVRNGMDSGGSAGPARKQRLATFRWDHIYGDDQRLTAGGGSNAEKIAALTAAFNGASGSLTAAASDFCSAFPNLYELTVFGDAQRPVRDALLSFQATRGGVAIPSSPSLADITVDNTNGALDTITASDDAGGATKTVQEIGCATWTPYEVTAYTERLKFRNFVNQFFPEIVRAWIELLSVAQARKAEKLLLDAIKSHTTLMNGGIVFIGAARQYVENLTVAVMQYRRIRRMGNGQRLQAIAPDWLATLIGSDLLNQAPGDGTINGTLDGMSFVQRHASNVGVDMVWARDDPSANDTNGAGLTGWTSMTAGNLIDFPGRVSTLIYPVGSMLFLDGGEFSIGEVRDSTLNAANRFELFAESWEGLGWNGIQAINLTSQLCASGQAGANTSTKCGDIGS